MNSGFWIYGAIPPEPSGGVSTFVERLANSNDANISGVIDPYYGEKNKIPVKLVTPKRRGVLWKIFTLFKITLLASSPLLVNVSLPKGVLFLRPFLFFRRNRTLLIMHHGAPHVPKNNIIKFLIRFSLSVFDQVGALSEDQIKFYKNVGLEDGKLELINPYIKPNMKTLCNADQVIQELSSWAEECSGFLVISSGYDRDFYHHDWVIDGIESKKFVSELKYLICCYGPTTQNLERLKSRAKKNKNVRVVYGLNPDQFGHVLSMADMYVRPTDIDSFGIAVWDALSFGAVVVASRACERPDNAILHATGDKIAFFDSLNFAIRNKILGNLQNKPVKSNRKTIYQFLMG